MGVYDELAGVGIDGGGCKEQSEVRRVLVLRETGIRHRTAERSGIAGDARGSNYGELSIIEKLHDTT